MIPLTIQSKSHPYRVDVAQSFASAVEDCRTQDRVFFLIDRTILRLYSEVLASIPSNRSVDIEATEEQKSYQNLPDVFLRLMRSGFRRDSTLVVIGGGVLQDIGCFICSVLFRGVHWELIPTTLLAQCDSCIGSKSSINIADFKNQIGTFYPPHRIQLAFDVLDTLPQEEIRSGIGEAIKLALIAGDSALEQTKRHLALLQSERRAALQGLVTDSLRIKKTFIEEDEFDRGIRNILNYGHTFGHAFESSTGYGIPHGTAVLLGVAAATYFSERLEMLPKGSTENLNPFLMEYAAPYEKTLLQADPERVLEAMKYDKKNTGGKLSFILTRGPGAMERVPLDLLTQVRPLLRDFLGTLARCSDDPDR